MADCLNREIIMAAASSEATEQLLASAKTTLLQVKTILVTQAEEGATRLRDAQIAFITARHERSSSTSASHVSQHDSPRSMLQQSGGQSCITERVTPVKVILMRRQPSVEVYGEMMSPDGSERVGSLIRSCIFD